jgi:isoamylase
LWDIDSDPVLAGTKLIAEAWDAAGLYQVGSFAGYRWKEWNGKFRDDIRGFFKGDAGIVSKLAQRLLASPDIFGHEEREPEQSINFITCHDGFTLNDLASYNQKHNEANGEENRDGSDNNLSWNCGHEGPTDDPGVEQLRKRQIKNFFVVTFLSLGVPMILMGDEIRRTQQGNNNAYCQNNMISWFDWTLVEKHRDIHRFVKCLIHARLDNRQTERSERLSLNELLLKARIDWHGVRLNQPDWSYNSHSLATIALVDNAFIFYLMLNAYKEPLEFELPPPFGDKDNPWRLWIDTHYESPEDIFQWNEAPEVNGTVYLVRPHSVSVLFRRTTCGI